LSEHFSIRGALRQRAGEFRPGLDGFSSLPGEAADEESRPRFREMILERGARGKRQQDRGYHAARPHQHRVAGNVGDSMVDDLRWQLEQARNDAEVKAVVLEVDSPGGEVTASDMIYNAVAKVRARKAGGRLHGITRRFRWLLRFLWRQVFDGQRDQHHRQHRRHYSNAELRAALQQDRARCGRFQKREVQGHAQRRAPITPEERDYVQSFVMKTYEKFLGVVAKERSLPAETLRNGIATGAFFPVGTHSRTS
jgi:protease-4